MLQILIPILTALVFILFSLKQDRIAWLLNMIASLMYIWACKPDQLGMIITSAFIVCISGFNLIKG